MAKQWPENTEEPLGVQSKEKGLRSKNRKLKAIQRWPRIADHLKRAAVEK